MKMKNTLQMFQRSPVILVGLFFVKVIFCNSFCNSLHAQTFTVSNLSHGNTVSVSVGTSSAGSDWRAVSFTPGASDEYDRYRIESVETFTSYTFTVPNAQLFIHEDNGVIDDPVGTLLGTTGPVSGTHDSSLGTDTHSFQEGVWVNEDTTYWLVFGAPATSQNFFYYSNGQTASDDQTTTGNSNPWMIGDTSLQSTDAGVTWTQASGSNVPKFMINAIPEPSEYVLAIAFAMGIFIFIKRQMKRRVSQST